ncbi:MAG: YggS family pyridoxal phosphate-dependent enzyme [Nitrospirota bacterium]
MGFSIAENLKAVKERVKATALRAGRDPDNIKIVVVTKTIDIDRIMEAISAGAEILGENRVQEAQKKVMSDELRVMSDEVEWHLIGHLQTNKVKIAVRLFDLIHSVDSLHLSREIDGQAESIDKIQDILIEVNVSAEKSKYGIKPEELEEFLKDVSAFKNLDVKGLMTMPPFSENPEDSRYFFRHLKKLSQEAGLKELSMGMSNDYEVAVEEGATMVRIGTAIFGERK